MGTMIRRYRLADRISTIYLLILIGNMFTDGVRSKPLTSGLNTNSLSKFETIFDKDYFTTYKNHSTLNNLPFITHTSFHPPDMPQQEALSRMKTTGQPTTQLSQSSRNTYLENKTPAGVMNTLEQIHSIYRTATEASVYDVISETELQELTGYSDSDYAMAALGVDLFEPINSVSMSPSLPLVHSDHNELYHSRTNVWSYSNTNKRRSLEDFPRQTLAWTMEPPVTSFVFQLRPSLTPDWEQGVPSLGSYSTLPLHTIGSSFIESEEETPRHSSTSRIIPRLLLFENQQKDNHVFLDTDKASSRESQDGLPSTNESNVPTIQSSMTNVHALQIDTHHSGVDILLSTSHGFSSDLLIDDVTTPTLSVNRPTISILMEPDSSFEDTHTYMDRSKEIMASKTFIEKTPSESIHNSKQSPKPSVSFLSKHNGYSSQLISNKQIVPDYTEKWISILPTVSAEIKNIHVSNLQSVLMNTSFPGMSTSMPSVQLDIVSSSQSNQASILPTVNAEIKNIHVSNLQSVLMNTSFPGMSTSMPSVQLDIVSSSQSNQVLEINNYLTDNSLIATDLSNQLVTSYNTDGQINGHSTALTESTKYGHISSEDTMMLLNGTKDTTHEKQSVYSLERTMLNTIYQSESSFMPSVTSFIDLASSSSIETSHQYSTLDDPDHSSKYIYDDPETEPGQFAGTEDTTDMKDIVVKTSDKEITIDININNNIVQEERKSTTTTTSTTTQQPPRISLELMVICAYMCQQRGSPIPPFCGCTLQAWLR